MTLNCQKTSVIVRDKNPYFTYCNIVFSHTKKKKKKNALFTATGLCHEKKPSDVETSQGQIKITT